MAYEKVVDYGFNFISWVLDDRVKALEIQRAMSSILDSLGSLLLDLKEVMVW